MDNGGEQHRPRPRRLAEPYVPERYAFEPGEGTQREQPTLPLPAAPPAAFPAPSPDATVTPAPATVPAGLPAQRVVAAAPAGSPEAYQRQSTEQQVAPGDLDLNVVLARALALGASDVHLTASTPPLVRVNGELGALEEFDTLQPGVIQRVMYAILTQKQRERFEEDLELDFAYSLPGQARFRVNMYRQREAVGAAFRRIPYEIKSLEELGMPPEVGKFAKLARGMVLVTGPTGSGKSTTLAAIIDLANRTRKDHIVTVEDPIEFLHRHKSCMVNQREVGEDTRSFTNALKHVLRQDPDIILVGEMRDLETISVALTAAETGHLVFATLHTQDAAQTIDRVIDVFPPHQQQQVRVQLAGALQGVVCADAVPHGRRRGADRGHRGDGGDPRDPQPDPRGQDPPGVLGAAGGRAARDAHPRPAPRRAVPATPDQLRAGPGEVPSHRGLQPAHGPGLRERAWPRRRRPSSTPSAIARASWSAASSTRPPRQPSCRSCAGWGTPRSASTSRTRA